MQVQDFRQTRLHGRSVELHARVRVESASDQLCIEGQLLRAGVADIAVPESRVAQLEAMVRDPEKIEQAEALLASKRRRFDDGAGIPRPTLHGAYYELHGEHLPPLLSCELLETSLPAPSTPEDERLVQLAERLRPKRGRPKKDD